MIAGNKVQSLPIWITVNTNKSGTREKHKRYNPNRFAPATMIDKHRCRHCIGDAMQL